MDDARRIESNNITLHYIEPMTTTATTTAVTATTRDGDARGEGAARGVARDCERRERPFEGAAARSSAEVNEARRDGVLRRRGGVFARESVERETDHRDAGGARVRWGGGI